MKLLMKNVFFICLLIAGFVQFGLAQNRANQVENLLKQGEAFLEEFEFEKAVAVCDEALEKFRSTRPRPPAKLASIHFLYGRIYEKGLYFDKAIAAYTAALKSDPRDDQIYQRRAYIFQYLGEKEKADADFAKADNLLITGKSSKKRIISPMLSIGAFSSNPAVIELPETFQTIGFKETTGDAETIVIKDLNKDGKTSNEEIRQGYILHLAKLSKIVSFNPESDLALWKRGDFFLQLDEINNQVFWISTETDFANAFEINPRYEYLVNRGVVRARRDNKTNYEFAVKLFGEAIEINDKCVEAFYNRGLSYLKLNENESAVADFTEAIKLNPKFLLAYKSRAKAFRAIGKIVEAKADEKTLGSPTVSEIQRPQPISDEELFKSYIFSSREQIKPIPDANEELKELTRKEINRLSGLLDESPAFYARAFVMRGHNYLKLGEDDRAIADYSEAIKFLEVDAINYRGVTNARKGNYDAAIADFTKALTPETIETAKAFSLELNPNTLLYNRALAQFNKGEFALAIDDLTAVLKSKPNNEKAFRLRAKAYRKISKIAEAEADEAILKSFEGKENDKFD